MQKLIAPKHSVVSFQFVVVASENTHSEVPVRLTESCSTIYTFEYLPNMVQLSYPFLEKATHNI